MHCYLVISDDVPIGFIPPHGSTEPLAKNDIRHA